MQIKILTCNVHAGAGLRNRGVRKLVKTHKPDIVCLQEVRSYASVVLNFILRFWYHTPRNQAGQFMLALKRDWKLEKMTNDPITPKGAPLNRGYQPQRNLVTMVLVHKKTGFRIAVGDIHTWAMGAGFNKHADKHVMNQHVSQVEHYATWARQRSKDCDLVVVVGDWNEDISQAPASLEPEVRKDCARNQMAAAGLKSLTESLKHKWEPTGLDGGGATLDEFFFHAGPGVRPTGREPIRAKGKGWDHKVVLASFEVK